MWRPNQTKPIVHVTRFGKDKCRIFMDDQGKFCPLGQTRGGQEEKVQGSLRAQGRTCLGMVGRGSGESGRK